MLKTRGGFTLIELLIVIGILGILSAAIVGALNPANLINQGRDTVRVSDLVSINEALKYYELDGGVSFGTSTKVYISLPDNNGDGLCNEYSLPTSSRTYTCAASSTYTAVNGTGWIPVNFVNVETLSFSSLPVDPVNTDSLNLYYSYLPGGSWKLSATVESSKYASLAANDGGTDSGEFEVGTNLSITHTSSATAPAQITDLAATAGDTEVDLSWSAPSNGGSAILYYNIYRGTSPGGESLTASTTNTSYTDTGRTNGLAYYYQVAAVNAVGTATLSNEDSATPFASGALVWAVTNNQTAYWDQIKAIAVDTSYIYLAGFDGMSPAGSAGEWRMERRNISDGSVSWSTSTSLSAGQDSATAIAIDSSYLYVAGWDSTTTKWRVEKRNISDGALQWATGTAHISDTPNGIAVDSSYVYVAGSENVSGGDNSWRVEKRNISDGSIVWATTTNPTALGDGARAIVVDASAVYTVGQEEPTSADYAWRIEKRDISTGALSWSTTTNYTVGSLTFDVAYGISADTNFLYVVGADAPSSSNTRWRIEKRSKASGAISWATTSDPYPSGDDTPYGVFSDASYVYIAGRSNTTQFWRIEKRSISDGSLQWATTTSGGNPYQVYAMAGDTNYIYVGGYDSGPGNQQWRLEKRAK